MGQHLCPILLIQLTVGISLLMVSDVTAETWYVTPLSQCFKKPTNESCLTLSQVAANTERYFTDNTTLVLLPGEHALHSQLLISNIAGLEIIARSSNVTVSCSKSGRFSVESISTVYIKNIIFLGCTGNRVTQVNHFILDHCYFHRIIVPVYAPLACIFFRLQHLFSWAKVNGGSLNSYKVHTLDIINSSFQNNIARKGGAIFANETTIINISNSTFQENIGCSGSGAVLVAMNANDTVTMNNCMFIKNRAVGLLGAGGVTTFGQRAIVGGSITTENCSFIDNKAESGGALLAIATKNITLSNTIIVNNTANDYGGAILVYNSTLTSSGFLEIEHNQGGIGVIAAVESEIIISGTNTMSNNCGSFIAIGSNVTFQGVTNFLNNKQGYRKHFLFVVNKLHEGGAVTALNSEVTFKNNASLLGNQAKNGGAILAIESRLHMNGDITICNNSALLSGGGIYAYQSELGFMGTNSITDNTADNEGGGIHAIGSRAGLLEGSLDFTANHASRGGGMFLESYAKLYIVKPISESPLSSGREHNRSIDFTQNSAEYGGAIYVSDSTNSGTCASMPSNELSSVTDECFLQIVSYINILDEKVNDRSYYFNNNSAEYSGKALYGGLLDRCTISSLAEISLRNTNQPSKTMYGGIYEMTDIKKHDKNNIASDPVRVCFCNGSQSHCSYQHGPVTVRKGERFVIPVVAVDQVGRFTPSKIHSSLQSQGGTFSEGQLLQTTTDTCTELQYNIFSPNHSEQLLLYAEGPCKDIGMSKTFIKVTFLPCDCPIGFEHSNVTQTNCSCICDSRIRSFVSDCSIETKSIVRRGRFWITYKNSSRSSQNGFIIYNICPFDYCYLPTTPVQINLNIPDGSDAQCAFNRSGVLCGSCQEGLSLSLGSSRCMSCSNHWLVLLIPFAIAGIALVAFLSILDLTVAVGTINGLIIYANIVIANRAVFFQLSKPNFLSVFIMWLNLDFGFETCFYDGMDGYAKVWLQLLFPTYVIVMVAMVILISEHSERFSRLVFKVSRNPVAILATLILLSYAKLLRTIIAALSFTTLEYPDGSHEKVWLYDANVQYLKGKHIPLFIAAVLILVVGVAFTLLLFLWQWLLKLSNWKAFCWLNNTRLKSFMDVYHAPYKDGHKYWTGLLLLARVLLYIVSSLDHVIGDVRVNLLSTICVVGGLLLLKEIQRDKTYKEYVKNIFESCFIFNLLIFASATYQFRETNEDQTVIAFISISIAFITFVGVVLYHFFLLLKRQKASLTRNRVMTMCCCFLKSKRLRRIFGDIADNEPTIVRFHTTDSEREKLLPVERPVSYSEFDGTPTIHADKDSQQGSAPQCGPPTSEQSVNKEDKDDFTQVTTLQKEQRSVLLDTLPI